jgi:AcrR family transcriptional regulator
LSQPARPEPLTARGRRTRDALLVAGRDLFETRGFNGTTADEIADAAGVSHGTFYTWFTDKDALLRALVDSELADAQQAFQVPDSITDPVARITEANRRYLTTFASYAKLFQVVEEVATVDPYYRDLLIALRRDYVARISTTISRMQAAGLVDETLDSHVTASALSAMVEGFGRHWLSRGEEHDADLAVTTLSRLWARALGLGDLPEQAVTPDQAATPEQAVTPDQAGDSMEVSDVAAHV